MNLQMVTASNTISQLQKKVDTIAHNISNVNTTGYKRREATFQNLLTQNIKNQPHAQKEIGRVTPYGIRVGHGARIGQTSLRYEQGAVQITDRPLDVLIEGENRFFRTGRVDENGILMGNETTESYTRNGSFQVQVLNGGLRLVTSQGDAILDADGDPIEFGEEYTEFKFDESGNFIVSNPATGDSETFQLGIVQVNRPDLLEAIGDTHFRLRLPEELENQRDQILTFNSTGYTIRQGALETSNVDLTHEMSELMKAQRMLQFQTRALSMADDMLGLANTIKG